MFQDSMNYTSSGRGLLSTTDLKKLSSSNGICMTFTNYIYIRTSEYKRKKHRFHWNYY